MQLRKRALGHAAAAAGVAPAVATPAPPAKRRQPRAGSRAAPKAIKVYQDIGIEHLLLGAGAQGVATPAVVTASQLGGVAPFADMAALQGACAELAKADPSKLTAVVGSSHELLLAHDDVLCCRCLAALAPLIETHGPPVRLLAKSGSSFATLAKGICFQQLATAAAAAIYGRVLQVCKAPDVLTPSAVLAAPTTELRAAGLSERKVGGPECLAEGCAAVSGFAAVCLSTAMSRCRRMLTNTAAAEFLAPGLLPA